MPPGDAIGGRLDVEQLASEAETSPERIERLVAVGALRPDDEGTFSGGDIVRSRLLAAFEAEGVTLEQIALGIQERAMTLEYVDLFYPPPSPRTGRTFGSSSRHRVSAGKSCRRRWSQWACRYRRPTRRCAPPTKPCSAGCSRRGRSATTRSWSEPRGSSGDAVRRIAEGWVGLFDEVVSGPAASTFRTVDELAERVVMPAARVNATSRALMGWLLDRHLERTMTELNVIALERELERRGLAPPKPIAAAGRRVRGRHRFHAADRRRRRRGRRPYRRAAR